MKWLPSKLGDLLTLEYGKSLPRSVRIESGAVPVAGSNGSDGNHNVALVKGPGIVVGRKGSAGKVTWFNTDFWPIDTTYFVEHDPKITNLRWLYYLLENLKLDRLNKTTGVPGLNRNDAYAEKCNLPAPAEQSRVVELLDEADYLRKLRLGADARCARILPALFLKMFGDPALNPKALPTEKLGLAVDLINGRAFHSSEWGKTGKPIIRIQNLKSPTEKFNYYPHDDLAEQFRVHPGDLLFSWSGTPGTSFGSFIWRGPEGWLNQHIFNVKPAKGYEKLFLHAHFQALLPRIIEQAHGVAGLRHITKSKLEQFDLFKPSPEMQIRFVRRAELIDELMQTANSGGQKLESLWLKMIQDAFSGQLTSKWREAHMKELLAEMMQQARVLNIPLPKDLGPIE